MCQKSQTYHVAALLDILHTCVLGASPQRLQPWQEHVLAGAAWWVAIACTLAVVCLMAVLAPVGRWVYDAVAVEHAVLHHMLAVVLHYNLVICSVESKQVAHVQLILAVWLMTVICGGAITVAVLPAAILLIHTRPCTARQLRPLNTRVMVCDGLHTASHMCIMAGRQHIP